MSREGVSSQFSELSEPELNEILQREHGGTFNVAGEKQRIWTENSTFSCNSIVLRPWICCWFSMALLMDREHPEAEREMPRGLEGLLKDIRLWIMEIGDPYSASLKISAQLWVLGRKWKYLLPEHTYAYDHAKKAKERKRLGKISLRRKKEKLGRVRGKERRQGDHVVPVSTFASPCSLLTVVLDASNCFSSGFNQRLTTSVRWEAYVILVLEYRQVCT